MDNFTQALNKLDERTNAKNETNEYHNSNNRNKNKKNKRNQRRNKKKNIPEYNYYPSNIIPIDNNINEERIEENPNESNPHLIDINYFDDENLY